MSILFISKRCRHCENIIEKIGKVKSLSESLSVFDVDVKRPPEQIVRVPSLVIGNTVYGGKDAFDYVDGLTEKSLETVDNTGGFSFIDGSSGVSNTGAYSIIDDNPQMMNIQDDQPSQQGSADDMLARLQQERDSQIPSCIQRQ